MAFFTAEARRFRRASPRKENLCKPLRCLCISAVKILFKNLQVAALQPILTGIASPLARLNGSANRRIQHWQHNPIRPPFTLPLTVHLAAVFAFRIRIAQACRGCFTRCNPTVNCICFRATTITNVPTYFPTSKTTTSHFTRSQKTNCVSYKSCKRTIKSSA